MSDHDRNSEDPLAPRIATEQLRAHYAQIPAMAVAPSLGGLFSAWVLWDAVDNRYLVLGMAVVITLSCARLLLWRLFFRLPAGRDLQLRWRVLAVAAALLSGCVWGSAAPLLYPPAAPQYQAYLLVLLTLLPVVPIAALAVYMPAFYAYFVPCTAPFITLLALHENRPERLTALLLLMMMAAMMTFAHRYSRHFAEAVRLRLLLADRSAALADAVAHKSRFIAAASHDLRQPVHAMGLFLETLRGQGLAAGDSRGMAFLHMALRNLSGMLVNMLDTARLDAAALGPQVQVIDLPPLLRRLLAEVAPQAERQGLRLRLRGVSAGLAVASDPLMLERMLRNLLGNSLKFTRHGGVTVVCRRRGAQLLLQVMDSGIGIAADQAAQVFQEFHQLKGLAADDGRSDEVAEFGFEARGQGLGLAIVQRMAGLLGHALRLRSRPGRGSVFTLALPIAQLPTPCAPVAADEAAATDDGPPMPSRLVLVIDDDAAVLRSTAALIRHWGHRTLAFTRADQALAMLAARAPADPEPDLLVADLCLGQGATGLEVAAQLRRLLGPALPVILVTADTSPGRIRDAVAAGHVLLHKPVDPLRLRACMAQALAAGRARAA